MYDPNHRRQDIFSTFSNNNLLINSNFEKAVNQRAETSKQTAGFFIDRWFYTGGGSVTIANQGLILDSTGTDYAVSYTHLHHSARATAIGGEPPLVDSSRRSAVCPK